MQAVVFPFIDAMGPHGVGHHIKLFVVFDQPVHQHFKTLVMHIIVSGAMNDHQFSLKILGKIDKRTIMVALRIIFQQTHIALLVSGIIQPLVRNKCQSKSNLVKVRIPKFYLFFYIKINHYENSKITHWAPLRSLTLPRSID